MTETRIESEATGLSFAGRILFLTEDTSLILRQLAGEDIEDELAQKLSAGQLPLMSNISTDEITPGWVCFYYDEPWATTSMWACRKARSRK